MAMVVANNTLAMMVLGELNRNNNKLKKDLQKAASGMRINDAADDVSGFAISEKMRARLRSLSQDIKNVQNGHSLLKTGLGGVDNIVEELRTLKELALNSCNDHNSELDRATLQKEFDARKAHIDYVANDTNYNGIPLLDGRWSKKIQTVISSGTEGGTTSKLISQTVERNVTKTSSTSETLAPTTTTQMITEPAKTETVTTTKTMDTNPGETTTTEGPTTSTATESKNTTEGPTTTVISSNTSNDDEIVTKEGNRTTIVKKETVTSTKSTSTVAVTTDTTTTTKVTKTISTSVEERNVTKPGEPKILYKGDTIITEDGVYEFDPEYTGDLYISAKNVQLQGPKTGETIKDLYISGPVDNLYLKDLKIENSKATHANTSTIAFRQTNTNNTLHLLGSNSIFIKGAATRETNNAVINAGGGLTIVGGGSMDIKVNGFQYGAMIGSDKGGSCGDIAIGQNVNISIVKNHHGSAGAGIGSGGGNGGGSCGNITIGTGAKVYIDMCQSSITYIAGFTAAAAIGSGDAFYSRPKCGNITIYSGADVTATAWYGAGIGSSTWSSECGNITIYSDAKVTAKSKEGADIGAGYYEDGYTTKVGNITIYSYSSGNVKADTIGSNNPKAGVGNVKLLSSSNHTEGGVLDLSEMTLEPTTETKYEVTTTTTTKTAVTKTIKETRTETIETFDEKEERITTSVYEETSSETSGEKLTVARGNPLIIHTGTKANQNVPIYIEDMRLDALGIKHTLIDPQENALKSLDIIDAAIDYALDQATTLGAYYNELEFTEANLTTSHENTTSSESVIRDADMAAAMADYTKNNVLLQASQSMLAQANQNASAVLSLLQ